MQGLYLATADPTIIQFPDHEKDVSYWPKTLTRYVRSSEIHYLDTITEAAPYFTFLQPLARIQFCGQFLIMISFSHSVHC